jgi:hypothetical protein
MRPRRQRWPWFPAAVAAFLSMCESRLSKSEDFADGYAAVAANVPVHPRGVNAFVKMAVVEAHRRLAGETCREIFGDFRDSSGRPLQERLDSIGQTPQSYLGWIRFSDAQLRGPCARTDVLAFTTPGSQVVSFCGEKFQRAIRRRGVGLVSVIIIHEELHSLGLGEDPPSSEEITRHVQARCGS